MMLIPENTPLVLFDGECGACNTFVQFVLDRDAKGKFRFAALQGETAKGIVGEVRDLSTVILVKKGTQYYRSDAVFKTLKEIGFPWALLAILLLIPRPIRDFFYRLFARNRHRMPWRKEDCRLLNAEERARFYP